MADIKEIDAAVALAESETGVRGGNTKLRVCIKQERVKAPLWTAQEKEFLKENLGRMTEEEIGRHLGRTSSAVRNHWKRELHLCPPSKAPDTLTAEHIGVGFGCCSKTVHMLIDIGLMPGRRLPTNGRVIRLVDRAAFLRWLSDPKHSLYFKPARLGLIEQRGKRRIGEYVDYAFWEEARELVQAVLKKWKDQWLTPVQAAKEIGIVVRRYPHSRRVVAHPESHYINKAILKGNLKATRWGNWWILKSDLPKAGMTINYQGQCVQRISST